MCSCATRVSGITACSHPTCTSARRGDVRVVETQPAGDVNGWSPTVITDDSAHAGPPCSVEMSTLRTPGVGPRRFTTLLSPHGPTLEEEAMPRRRPARHRGPHLRDGCPKARGPETARPTHNHPPAPPVTVHSPLAGGAIAAGALTLSRATLRQFLRRRCSSRRCLACSGTAQSCERPNLMPRWAPSGRAQALETGRENCVMPPNRPSTSSEPRAVVMVCTAWPDPVGSVRPL
jgi:hypothetical protein